MEDCELFIVCSTEMWSVVISISSIKCVYLAITKGGVKRMRKKVIMVRVHKTRNKERINNVKAVKDIKGTLK